jgi:hypothetical protein
VSGLVDRRVVWFAMHVRLGWLQPDIIQLIVSAVTCGGSESSGSRTDNPTYRRYEKYVQLTLARGTACVRSYSGPCSTAY